MKKLIILILFIKIWAINILILNSYSSTLKWTSVQNHTLIHKLRQYSNIKIYTEFLDTKNFKPTTKYFESYKYYLVHKYKKPFDIIITTDDNALNFVRKYKNLPIFKNAKVFFEGINNLSLQNKLDRKTYTGVFEQKNPLSNLNIAKKIYPNIDTIYVISDHSTSGDKTIQQYQQAFKNIKNINFVYLNDSNLENILKKLKNYKKHSVIMLLTFGSMKYNNNILFVNKVPQILSKYYHNPILVHNDIYTNIPHTNIIGGDCTDAKQQASLNIDKVIAYLNHTPINQIPFDLKKANRIYLNVKNLQKFGINADSLNIPNAVFINQPTSFYEIYKNEIISASIILAIIIISLILVTKKNREIQKLNQNLEKKIQQAILENQKKEQIIFQQSKLAAMGEMIGAIAHQWRQPLNSLALHIQLLVDDFYDKKVDEKYMLNFEKKNIDIIHFMSKTIDDFRNFFQKDKEKIKFKLKDSIKETIKLIDKQLKKHNIQISIDGDNSEIEGYPNEFKQVILNLINNAKDAIISNNIQNGNIKITIKNNKITIEDNGGGIDDNIKNRIFEPYFTTKSTNGTGIGLYMSKIIIEDHMKGKLYFTTENNTTKFIIEF